MGIGFVKGGGTIAAAVTCVCWFLLQPNGMFQNGTLWITALVLVLGVWSGNSVEADWGKDSSRVVIDEVAGMAIGLLFVPVTLPNLVTGLVLFRFFDIVKPLYIRRAEALPGGWGVMADDVLAGVYTNLVLQLTVNSHIL